MTIPAALGLVAVLSAASIAWIFYRSSREMMVEAARALVAQVSERIAEQARSYLGPVKNTSLIEGRLAASGELQPDDLRGMERRFFAVLAEYHRIKMIEFGRREREFPVRLAKPRRVHLHQDHRAPRRSRHL